MRGFRGPVLPGGLLLGLGAGLLLEHAFAGALPRWVTLLLFLGLGLLLVAGLGRVSGQERRPAPFVPGTVLVAIAIAAGLARRFDLEPALRWTARLWPWALVGAGIVLVLTAWKRK